jgi:hypothetical protein
MRRHGFGMDKALVLVEYFHATTGLLNNSGRRLSCSLEVSSPMGHKSDSGKIHSSTLDDLIPGEPFHVLRGSSSYSLSLTRRKLKRGLRDGTLSSRESEGLRETIAAMEQWPKTS